MDGDNELRGNEYGRVLRESVREGEVDLVMIGGDMGNGEEMVVEFIDGVEEVRNIRIGFVGGNDDLWR
ncbi:hypothetical protein [Staphylococcus pettenkoferi]|uniref:hypothetical protein n=1 Tax=Staphylococcus pettenkoferi TaxID=170573 RepID=UPI00119FBCF2|nr:hypothetical protein [Staphylococcus pettenkoferi]